MQGWIMEGISKETLLRADDSKNRDAMLFDMLECIDNKIDDVLGLKKDIECCKRKISFIKGIGTIMTALFSVVIAWIAKVLGN